MVVSSAHYLTDYANHGSKGRKELEPIENMSPYVRVARSGDCEDFAREVTELYRSLSRMTSFEGKPTVQAANFIAKCYIPMVTLGFVYRPAGSDPWYKTRGGRNAHCWAILVGTLGFEILQKGCPWDDQQVKLDEKALVPWSEKGLPTLIVDATQTRLFYPKSKEITDSDALMKINPLVGLQVRKNQYVSAIMDLNLDFYQYIRNVYVPYGVVGFSSNRQVFELFMYTLGDENQRPYLVECEVRGMFNLPHVAPKFGVKPEEFKNKIFVAASVVPTEDEMDRLKPHLDSMFPPLGPYESPSGELNKKMESIVGKLQKKLGSIKNETPTAVDRWVSPAPTFSVKYAEAYDEENLAKIAEAYSENMLGARVWYREFVKNEPWLFVTVSDK